MHIKEIRVRAFKRFTNLAIEGLSEDVQLVVLCGPNGSGKSSTFDAFIEWHSRSGRQHGMQYTQDPTYFLKVTEEQQGYNPVVIEFHEPVPSGPDERKKIFYVRSAYRLEPDFSINHLQRRGSIFESQQVRRLIDQDVSVSENYQHLVSLTLEKVYSGDVDSFTVADLRDLLIGEVRQAMLSIFNDLMLEGAGDPLQNGAFFFTKGASANFHYKNLSAGEKAAFDLLLDMVVKTKGYDNTVFCIDEPEAHMNTRLQATLLRALVGLLPSTSQLWIATHSIGMMRAAREMRDKNPGSVVFLDYSDNDYDGSVVLRPVAPDRHFWKRQLDVALADLAELVAPARVVLCEGRAARSEKDRGRAEFDARCFRTIFQYEYPDTDFLSVGNEEDVRYDRLEIGHAIQTIVSGTKVVRVVDRDDRSPEEIEELLSQGVRVLRHRNLESYLLSDEMIELLCAKIDLPEKRDEALKIKADALRRRNVENGKAIDDVKSSAGLIYVGLKRLLALTAVGSNADAFLASTMAPLVKPGTETYEQLRHDIFASAEAGAPVYA